MPLFPPAAAIGGVATYNFLDTPRTYGGDGARPSILLRMGGLIATEGVFTSLADPVWIGSSRVGVAHAVYGDSQKAYDFYTEYIRGATGGRDLSPELVGGDMSYASLFRPPQRGYTPYALLGYAAPAAFRRFIPRNACVNVYF